MKSFIKKSSITPIQIGDLLLFNDFFIPAALMEEEIILSYNSVRVVKVTDHQVTFQTMFKQEYTLHKRQVIENTIKINELQHKLAQLLLLHSLECAENSYKLEVVDVFPTVWDVISKINPATFETEEEYLEQMEIGIEWEINALFLDKSLAKHKLGRYYEPIKSMLTDEEYMEDDETYPADLDSLESMLIQLSHNKKITSNDTYYIACEFGILDKF